MDKSWLVQEWVPTEQDNLLHKLAEKYHQRCEAYDRTICTGPSKHGVIHPAFYSELAAINRHALQVQQEIITEGLQAGLTIPDIKRAIHHWKG